MNLSNTLLFTFIFTKQKVMKLICLKTRYLALLMSFIGMLAFQSCGESPSKSWIRAVWDDKAENGQLWELKYDYWGRLSQYGKTHIDYNLASIKVDSMVWNDKNMEMHDITYTRWFGNVSKIEAYCTIEVDSMPVEAKKVSKLSWEDDSLFVNSTFNSVIDNELLKTITACYVYDEENRITEIITWHYDASGSETSIFHSYLVYRNPVHYIANLNISAYIVDWNGLDLFMYFLLSMDKDLGNYRAVPTTVHRCVNHGSSIYEADGLYRMKNERLYHMEFISTDVRLMGRMDFTYFNEEHIRTGRLVQPGHPSRNQP